MAFLNLVLPERLQQSTNKEEVIRYLYPIAADPQFWHLIKAAFLEWGQFNNVEITGEDIERLKGGS